MLRPLYGRSVRAACTGRGLALDIQPELPGPAGSTAASVYLFAGDGSGSALYGEITDPREV